MWTCRNSWNRHTWRALGQAYLGSSLARDRLKQIRLQVSNDLTQIPALEFTSCVAVGKSLHLSEPWFPHLWKRSNNRDRLIGVF